MKAKRQEDLWGNHANQTPDTGQTETRLRASHHCDFQNSADHLFVVMLAEIF